MYMQWIVLLFDDKPVSEPMMAYCQLDLRNEFLWNLVQNTIMPVLEIMLEMSEKFRPICLGPNLSNSSRFEKHAGFIMSS